ncbi:hypothetical protein [Blastomonas sp. AAP53]|uniref:hypothetical protein n=1 Tax=Blastomonas sp. AAP53 TaxID=1248760 RepID=UPI00187C4EC8|nr:hypothetical protein [Blastomonas sp. AAP53]
MLRSPGVWATPLAAVIKAAQIMTRESFCIYRPEFERRQIDPTGRILGVFGEGFQ